MPTRRSTRTPAPFAALGFALAMPAAVGTALLREGGLAPLACAVVIATAIGVPLATVEWTARSSGPPGPLEQGARALADLWALLFIGAVAGPWVRDSTAAMAIAALGWLVAALATRAGVRAAPLVAGAALFLAVGSFASGWTEAPPWTLLEPGWVTWHAWLPNAVVGGFLLACAGFGQWQALPEPVPGTRRQPWAVVGTALVFAVLVAVRAGSWFEAGHEGVDPLGLGVAALALAAAGCAVLERDGVRENPFLYAGAGLVATLWFAGPAAGAEALWWGSLVLVGPIVGCALLAVRVRGNDRAVAGVATLLLLAGAIFGWPGVAAPAAAAAAATTLVVAVWVAGTRALLRRPA